LTTPHTDRTPALHRAAEYLRSVGFRVLDSDWRQDDGTLDIIAVHNGTLVACVLTSRPQASPRPLHISQPRQRLARSLAVRWMKEHGLSFPAVRVDLIGLVHSSGGYTIEHVRGVA
jgi:Holliday junction resolvase-like predicted endonuclease